MSDVPGWTEENSQTFLDLGRYFVPEREAQIETLTEAADPGEGERTVLELGCGEGLLAEALLQRYPDCRVVGLDGSPAMLAAARKRLQSFGERFRGARFDLADRSWRTPGFPVHAVISSLAIHHLDGEAKRALYHDLFRLLQPGGRLAIGDVVETETAIGQEIAARAWEDAVRARSLALDGNLDVFERFQSEGWNMYRYINPDDVDKPSPLMAQLHWLKEAGFAGVDVYWMRAGHAIFGAVKPGATT